MDRVEWISELNGYIEEPDKAEDDYLMLNPSEATEIRDLLKEEPANAEA
jgi:hypothetical protein